MNYIRDIKLNISEESFNAIIEIPKGTNKKYELNDPKFDKVECVRKVVGKYPFYYGCFPQTFAGDKDPLDMILISNKKRSILDVVEVLPFAVIKTLDDGDVDDKIICLAADETYTNLTKSIQNMVKFIHTYKGKNHKMIIDPKSYDGKEAIRLIKEANNNYRNKNNSIKITF